MLTDAIAGVGFAALVATGVAVARMPSGWRASPSAPLRIHLFLSLGLGLSLLAGLAQRNLWPFVAWRMMPEVMPADARIPAMMCVDSAGSTFPVDYRAWRPLSEEELEAWIKGPFTEMAVVDQDSARATLLRMAESARLRVRAGGNAAVSPSIFGTWAASTHLLHPRRWNVASDAPATPCVALRWVEHRWNLEDRAAGRGEITEATVWEYRPAP